MERCAWPKNLSSSRKHAIKELLHGQNPTKKIRHLFDAHSQTGNDTAQPLIAEDPIVNVLRSFSNTLSLSSSAAESYEVLPVPANACVRSEVSVEVSEESIKPPPVPTNACVRSEVSGGRESIHTPVPRKISDTRTRLDQNLIDNNGHKRRTYDQKLILNSKSPKYFTNDTSIFINFSYRFFYCSVFS
ncbi:uncharacterized protein LOC125316743 isoform X1 [Rhodamnia argentea]|uniref:Uncharacterized protein LOC125316743 isoform X1 n=1 Tax=Rhodamnia argentea TaxID=178133 RepID=A0ABM3HZC9_9MYRT|nr:uncharacterized protein LOC125316743 isoform X1 [Rhodamnia argentea]